LFLVFIIVLQIHYNIAPEGSQEPRAETPNTSAQLLF